MSECIQYDGYIMPNGYGLYKSSPMTYAHRHAWEEANGSIPKGLVIDHICHNESAAAGLCSGGDSCTHRSCVNPEHLVAKTQSENVLGGMHSNSVKLTCKKGHSYKDPRNIMTRKNGWRECAECNRQRASANYYKQRQKIVSEHGSN